MASAVQGTEISLDGVSVAFLVEFAAECRRTFPDADTASTDDVCKRMIKPATEGAKCSYKDLLKRTGRAHHVRQATIFLSHAWKYPFQLVIETFVGWCEREGLDARSCFVWFDIFTVNQHTGITDFAYWSEGFRRAVRSIGRVVILLLPWDDAIWLSRAWCLYEYWAACAGNVQHEFLLPERDQAAFVAYLEGGGTFENLVKNVDISRAECFDKEDERQIKGEVKCTMGFAPLNEAVTAGLRGWYLASADDALRRFPTESERLASDLQFSAAEMRRTMGLLSESEDMLVRRQGELQRRLKVAGAQELQPLQLKVADTLTCLGAGYCMQGKYDAAIKVLGEALAIQRAALGESHPHTAKTMLAIGFAYGSQGNYILAIEHFTQVLAIQRAALGENHPHTALTMMNIGEIYRIQGNYSRAIEHFTEALAVQRAVLGENHPDTAMTMMNVGSAYCDQDNYSLAIEHYAKALAIQRAALGESHPDTAKTMLAIGAVYYNQGNYSLAIEYFTKALAIQRTVLGENHPDTATTAAYLLDARQCLAQVRPLRPTSHLQFRSAICALLLRPNSRS